MNYSSLSYEPRRTATSPPPTVSERRESVRRAFDAERTDVAERRLQQQRQAVAAHRRSCDGQAAAFGHGEQAEQAAALAGAGIAFRVRLLLAAIAMIVAMDGPVLMDVARGGGSVGFGGQAMRGDGRIGKRKRKRRPEDARKVDSGKQPCGAVP
jgi:hypothetical protein